MTLTKEESDYNNVILAAFQFIFINPGNYLIRGIVDHVIWEWDSLAKSTQTSIHMYIARYALSENFNKDFYVEYNFDTILEFKI